MSARVLAFGLCVAACVLAHAFIFASIVRRRATPAAEGVPQPRFAVELLWALIPVLALALLLTATWPVVRARETPRPGVILKVAQ